jgi:plastocyanin domain-containing protein
MIAVCVLALSFAASAQTHRKTGKSKVQTAKVLINEQGYAPGSLNLRKGVPAKITFLRTTERTCGTEIVIPAYGINQPLPLNQAVLVSFTPKKTGEFGFTCGMNMMHGKLIVQ